MGIDSEELFDWEVGYENILNRSKTAVANTANAVSPNTPAVNFKAVGATTATVHATINANISTRMRSHTTAVRDRAPDDKNRALDTQAPITMGEDDDEQTGYCRYYPTINGGAGNNSTTTGLVSANLNPLAANATGKLSQHDSAYEHESSFLLLRQDKPKYKRQEFLRYYFIVNNNINI